MALTLGQGAQIVADVGYQTRVRAAMVRAAVAVSTETQGALSGNAWMARRRLAIRILNGPDAVLSPFLAAVAADPNNSLTWNKPVGIASSTNADPSVVTTSSVHGLVVGDIVEVAGHVGNTAGNGTWTLATVGSTTTFTVPAPANGVGTATGTAMKMIIDSDLVFTINSVFSAIAGLLPGD